MTTTDQHFALRAESVTLRFPLPQKKLFAKPKHLVAVDDVDIAVRPGRTLGIVGESGCGKSTLGRVLIGLNRPDSGTIEWAGTSAQAHTGQVQAVFQDPASALNPRRTIQSALAESMVGVDAATVPVRAKELMGIVGLDTALLESYPHELSGGQQQRVCIARAIASDPDLILFDEAVSSLDASRQAQVVALLKDLQQRIGSAYIFISHDLRAVRGISDHIVVMYLGQIVESAPADSFDTNLLHPYSVALRSAEPALPTDAHRVERIFLRGDPPSAVNLPPGCRFASRCPMAQERCLTEAPELRELDDGHLVRCHFPGSLTLTPRADEGIAESETGNHRLKAGGSDAEARESRSQL